MLELGTFRGRATFALARSAELVWTVDWHQGDQYGVPSDSLGIFAQGLERHPHRSRIVAVVGSFDQVLPQLLPGRFDVVFCDAAKQGDALRWELEQALRQLRAFGDLALHDWGRWEVSDQAARLGLGAPEVVDSLAVWRGVGGRSRT